MVMCKDVHARSLTVRLAEALPAHSPRIMIENRNRVVDGSSEAIKL